MQPTSGSSTSSVDFSTALGVASAGLVLAALPVFLVGGLAVQIRAELGFTETALGAAVTLSFLTGAAAGPVGGKLADRLGARGALLAGSSLSVTALAGLALVVRSWVGMVIMLVLAGSAFSLIDPGLAILVSRAVPPHRQGTAFGVKEASIPAATLVAGLAVPAVAVTVGWRWAFLVGAVPLGALGWLLRRVPPVRPGAADQVGVERGTASSILLVAVAAALGTAAGSGVGVFLTTTAVEAGFSPSAAGILLAMGSVAGILTRLGAGIVADRGGRDHLGLMAVMLALGAVGLAVGASGMGVLLAVGTVGAFVGAWGWTGLLFLTLVRLRPGSPGSAAGLGLMGLAVGNAAGPLLYGAVGDRLGFEVAWALGAAMAAVASGLVWKARRRLNRSEG